MGGIGGGLGRILEGFWQVKTRAPNVEKHLKQYFVYNKAESEDPQPVAYFTGTSQILKGHSAKRLVEPRWSIACDERVSRCSAYCGPVRASAPGGLAHDHSRHCRNGVGHRASA